MVPESFPAAFLCGLIAEGERSVREVSVVKRDQAGYDGGCYLADYLCSFFFVGKNISSKKSEDFLMLIEASQVSQK